MATANSNTGYFSISAGGLFHAGLVKLGIYNKPVKLVGVFLLFTWFPLLVITAFEGTIYSGVRMSFLGDVAMQIRLLVALPMLLLIGLAIDSKAIEVQAYFSNTLMSDREQQLTLRKALSRARKLTESAIVEIIMLLIVIGIAVILIKATVFSGLNKGNESWIVTIKEGSHQLSIAGQWVVCISLPVVQYLLLRWVWRYLIWGWLLFQLSRARLNLQYTHADQFGGLGILIYAQKYFSLIFVVISTILSGELIARLNENPGLFFVFRTEVIGYIVLCLIAILLPLVFFAGVLIKTKNEGLIKLGNLGTALSSKFEKEWIGEAGPEKKIPESKISTSDLQDYSGIYQSWEKLHTVPVKLKDIVVLCLMIFIPFIPILFIHFSMGELLQKIVGLLL